MKWAQWILSHPVAMVVLNVFVVLLGLLSLNQLPLREYPKVEYPAFYIFTSYPSASPQLVEQAVTNPLEEQLAGLSGIEHVRSKSSLGSSHIEVQFKDGIDANQAFMDVKDAVNSAKAYFSKNVREPLLMRKAKAQSLPFIALSLKSSEMPMGELTHYANRLIKNALRMRGIGSIEVGGTPYAMEIKLDQSLLYHHSVNIDEIMNTITKNTQQYPAGQFHESIPATLLASSFTPFDFENILVKKQGSKNIYIKSVAEVSLKTLSDYRITRINHEPAVLMDLQLASDANPLEVSKAIEAQVQFLKTQIPKHMSLEIILNQSYFMERSLYNVKTSIWEAILLVLLVVWIFLRNLRATLIPIMTIPISLLGACIFLKLFGYSLNTLSLLGILLGVGLVVDDAIVVLENIAHHLELGLSPKEASLKGLSEMGFAILAMTFTLISVYMPIAFMSGAIGTLFSEFAVALGGGIVCSGFVAMTLSPLMCQWILKPVKEKDFLKPILNAYETFLNGLFKYAQYVFGFFVLCVLFTLFLASGLNQELAPPEDRGFVGIFVPVIATQTVPEMSDRLEMILDKIGPIDGVNLIGTNSGPWGGQIYLPLKPHLERFQNASEIVKMIEKKVKALPFDVWPWNLDQGLPGVETSETGEEMKLVVMSSEPYEVLFERAESLKKQIEALGYPSVSHNLNLDHPIYNIELNTAAMHQLQISPETIARTVEVFFSGNQNLEFSKDGLMYGIAIKGKKPVDGIEGLYVTNPLGQRISLGALASMNLSSGPKDLQHEAQLRAFSMHIKAGDKSLQKAIKEIELLAKENLPKGYQYRWGGAIKAQKESSQSGLWFFVLALLFIYGILCIQFASFLDGWLVLITAPLGAMGALFFAYVFGQSLNIYTQVGLVTLIGLLSKHGILLVEFANQLVLQGHSTIDAIKIAAVRRLRPILMTTAAMVLGVLPLVLSHDAGFEARRAMGIILLGGLLWGTCLTLCILPVLYGLIKTNSRTLFYGYFNS